MSLNNFTFVDAAELDQELITHYFITTAEYQQAGSGKTNFIIGRVGTGKSAIVEKLRADAEVSGGLIVDLTARGGSDLIAFRRMETAAPTIQPEYFEKAWKYTLLIRIMKALIDAGQGSLPGLDWDYISQSLNELGILTQTDPIGQMTAFISKHAGSLKKLKIAGVEIERELAALLSKYDPVTLIDGCLPRLKRLLKKRPTWVLIDGVDLGFNDPDKAENFILGHYRSIPSLAA